MYCLHVATQVVISRPARAKCKLDTWVPCPKRSGFGDVRQPWSQIWQSNRQSLLVLGIFCLTAEGDCGSSIYVCEASTTRTALSTSALDELIPFFPSHSTHENIWKWGHLLIQVAKSGVCLVTMRRQWRCPSVTNQQQPGRTSQNVCLPFCSHIALDVGLAKFTIFLVHQFTILSSSG